MSSSICEANPRRNLRCFSVQTVRPNTELGRHVHQASEQEWELAAIEYAAAVNFVETGRLHTAPSSGSGVQQFFGDCREWTASPYIAYPGYKAPPGAFGEYNGKFMSGTDDPSGRLLRYAGRPYTGHLSQFLSPRDPLAILRDSARVSHRSTCDVTAKLVVLHRSMSQLQDQA
jgi:hypothetical protein